MAEININGIKTNYVVVGKGEPFVIFHGWGSNTDRWVEVADLISKQGFQVIVPDLPGFGKSDELHTAWNMNNYLKWAEEFVKAINLKDYLLAGHSFGGALAVKLAIKYPQNVKKLFLISAASVRKQTTQKFTLKRLSKLVKLFSFVPGYAFFRKAFYKFVIRRSDYPYVSGLMKETFKNVISEDLSQFTGFLKIPTILIWGNKDKSTPIEDAQFMNKKIKNSKLVIIDGAGHALNRENPETLVQHILENV